MTEDGEQRQSARKTWQRLPSAHTARGRGELGDRLLDEELRRIGRKLLEEPVPQHLREILAAVRSRRD